MDLAQQYWDDFTATRIELTRDVSRGLRGKEDIEEFLCGFRTLIGFLSRCGVFDEDEEHEATLLLYDASSLMYQILDYDDDYE